MIDRLFNTLLGVLSQQSLTQYIMGKASGFIATFRIIRDLLKPMENFVELA